MLAGLRRFIGSIKVTETAGRINISGLPTNTISKDIQTQWATSRITKYMFTKMTAYEVEFYSFFAVELLHILETLTKTRGIRTNRRALNKIIEELKTETWLRNIDKQHDPVLNFDKLSEIRFKMLDHQMAFLQRYNYIKPRYGLRGALLMVPPGGGKTIADIAIACCAESEVVFVVSPKNAVNEVWAKTLRNDMTYPQKVWVAADGQPFRYQDRWYIFHFETLDIALNLAKTMRGKKCTIILDESHGFNDVDSLRTQRFLELCQVLEPTDIVWASGTPIKAMGAEAIPLIRSIDPLFTPEVEQQFKKMFAGDATKAYDILNHRLGIISYKVPKSQFMAEKPEMLEIKVRMPNGDYYTLPKVKERMEQFIRERRIYYSYHQERFHKAYYDAIAIYEKAIRSREEREAYEEYQRIVNIFVKQGFDSHTMGPMAKSANQFEKRYIIPALPKEMRLPFIDAKSVVKYVDLKIRGESLGRVLSKEREQCHVAMVKHVDFENIIDNAEKKTLIFTSFVPVVDEAFNHLSTQGYKPVRVYGDTNSNLQSIISSFRDNEDVNPTIATYQSLSTAVPMIMANTLIMLNSPFRYHEQEQAISRCLRLGQDKTVYVYRVFLDTDKIPNLSTRSEDIQEWSRQMVDAIIGIDGSTEEIDVGLECYGDDLDSLLGESSHLVGSHKSRYW